MMFFLLFSFKRIPKLAVGDLQYTIDSGILSITGDGDLISFATQKAHWYAQAQTIQKVIVSSIVQSMLRKIRM